MITEIIVTSRHEMCILKSLKKHPIEMFKATNENWNLISIYGSFKQYSDKYLTSMTLEILKHLDCQKTLSLQFDDIEIEHHSEHSSYILFSEADACKILNFADDLNKVKEPETLIIHCHAGISRSGAIGLYLTERFKLDVNEFKRKHPFINPNKWVYETLKMMDYPRIKEYEYNLLTD